MPNYPKLLSDPSSTRPDLLVTKETEESRARADGYSKEIPVPESYPMPGKYPLRDPYASAKGFVSSDPAASYKPVKVNPDINVKVLVGPRQVLLPDDDAAYKRPIKLQDRTSIIRHHDTVIDMFARISVPTDGSMVLLIPETPLPFQMEDYPYDAIVGGALVPATKDLLAGVTLYIVPNQPDQVGPMARPSSAIPLPAAPSIPQERNEVVIPASAEGPEHVAPKAP